MNKTAIAVTMTGWTLLALALTMTNRDWSGLALWSVGVTAAGLLWVLVSWDRE